MIKTRIQNQNFESKQGGAAVIRDLLKNEGAKGFFKGLTPKVLIVGPKLIFSFTLAQSLIPIFGRSVTISPFLRTTAPPPPHGTS